MKRTFHLALPNGLLGDPLVVLRPRWLGRTLLLDVGDTARLGPRLLLSVGEAFLSHLHVDHAFGLGRLLRSRLEHRERPLRLFGPAGLAGQVRSHLGGYTWNLVRAFPLDLTVVEIHDGSLETWRFPSAVGFDPELVESRPWPDGGEVHSDNLLRVRATRLLHGDIDSVSWRLDEHRRLNIDPVRLARLGKVPGPWLSRLKTAVLREEPAAPIEMPGGGAAPAGELAAELIREEPGDSVTYVVDAAPTAANLEAIVAHAHGSERLLIEAYYLGEDVELSRKHSHLTAAFAGEIARKAAVRAVCPLHVSGRYTDRLDFVLEELRRSSSPIPVEPLAEAASMEPNAGEEGR